MKVCANPGKTDDKLALSGSAVPSVLIATALAITLILNTPICRIVGERLADSQIFVQRKACDTTTRFNWDVRTAASISSLTDRQLTLNSCDGSPVTYNFDPNTRTITRTKGSEKIIVATGVDSASFSLYRRPSLYNELLPATKENARIVGLKWTTLCANGASKAPQTAMASLQLASQ